MKKKDLTDHLDKIFEAILVHLDLIGEIVSLTYGSGFEGKFLSLLIARISQLAACGLHATVLKEFEPLGGGLFSMHLSGKGFNIRILYGFLQNGQPVLLLAFHERAGKSKSDYSSFIPIASNRLQELRKGFESE